MTTHLSAHDLACHRGSTPVLTGIDLAIEEGSRWAIVGPNGAGKSTLLRVLAGLDQARSGAVELRGRPLDTFRLRDRARQIAIVSQHEQPPADLLVRELVVLGRIPHRSPWATAAGDDDLALSALARLDLTDLADRPVDRLSGGELRRVLVARALAQEAPLLILDEPTNHLDLRHQHELLAMVADLDLTVVAAIHDLDLADRYFTRVAVVHDGGLVAQGDPATTLAPALVRRVFGVNLTRVAHPESGEIRLLIDP